MESLDAFLLVLLKKYSGLLQNEFRKSLAEIVQNDDYMPMPIKTPDEYEKVVSVSWYKPDKNRDELE